MNAPLCAYQEKRKKAFEELRTSTHWPHKFKLFPKTPRTYGAELPDIQQICFPKINDTVLKLVGYDKTKIIEEEKCIFIIEEE